MWVPWAKSPGRIHTRAPSSSLLNLDDYYYSSTPPTPCRSPIHHHHHHSLSFKDVESLFNPYPPPSPTHLKNHHPISFKDIHSLLNDDDNNPNPPHSPARKSSIFHRVRAWAQAHQKQPPEAQNRVVIYYTSLRVVRKTFEDCRAVRSILKGYRVKIDERDLSMDGAYKEELMGVIGGRREKRDLLSLPRVFVSGKYVGGAEEIRRLHESGDLKRLIQGLPPATAEGRGGGGCGGCGGFRFKVCEKCGGSHRVYIEKVGFKGCNQCNENGLVRCGSCTSVLF